MEVSRDKKFMVIGLAFFLMVVLSNFLDSNRHVPPTSTPAPKAPVVYLDADTGCEYLMIAGASLIPRMEADGRQRCRSKAAADKAAASPPAPPAPVDRLSPADLAATLVKMHLAPQSAEQGATVKMPSSPAP